MTENVKEIIDPSAIEEIGKFRRTHALRGELNAELYEGIDEDQLAALDFIIVEAEGIPTPFRIESVRPKGAVTVLVKLIGIDSADRATPFVNQPIYADVKALEESGFYEAHQEDTEGVYAADLTGYHAVDPQGRILGKVEHVDVSTSNPLLELLDDNGQKVLIPVNGPFITHIDPQHRMIGIDAPDALLGLNFKKS